MHIQAQGVHCFHTLLTGPIKKPLPITRWHRTKSDSIMTVQRLGAPTSHGLVLPGSPGLWCLAPQPVGVWPPARLSRSAGVERMDKKWVTPSCCPSPCPHCVGVLEASNYCSCLPALCYYTGGAKGWAGGEGWGLSSLWGVPIIAAFLLQWLKSWVQWGTLVFSTTDWDVFWHGTNSYLKLEDLAFRNRDSGQPLPRWYSRFVRNKTTNDVM